MFSRPAPALHSAPASRVSPSLPALLLLLLALAGAPAASGDAPPWQRPFAGDSDAILQAAGDHPPSEEGVRVLLEELEVVFDGEHRATTRLRRVYTVEEEWAVEGWGQVYADWSPWFQERPEVRARVMSPDGRERHLDPATVVEMPRESYSTEVLSDAVTLRAPLPGVVVGAVVEEEVVTRESSPMFPAGVSRRFVFGAGVPTEQTRLVLDAPVDLPLAWRIHALPGVEAEETVADGRRRVVFEAGPQEPLEWPSGALPGDVRLTPQVAYSTARSWEGVSAAYARMVEAQLAQGDADLAAVVAEVAPPEMPREQRIAALTAWVHREARYTSVALGEASIVPRSPAEVLERGYGDCKDKSTLLVGLLREAGIPARVALVSTGPGEDVEPDLPGLGRFDHAIVQVPGTEGEAASGGDGEAVWIDATAPTYPPGLVPEQVAGRRALPATEEGAGLVAIPHLRPEDNRQTIHREIVLPDFGRGRIIQVTEDHGASAAWWRSYLQALDEEERKAEMETYVEETWPGSELESWSVENLDDLSRPLVRRLEVGSVQAVATGLVDAAVALDGTELVIDLPLWLYLQQEDGGDEGEDGEAETVAEEEEPPPAAPAYDHLQDPHLRELHARIVPPPGFLVSKLPEGDELRMGPSLLTRRFEAGEDGTVQISMHLDSGGPRITPEDLAQGQESAQRLVEEEPLLVVYADAVQQHLNAGRVVEAIGAGRKLVEVHPESGIQRVRRALALLAGGLGDAAREEAETAATLSPDEAAVHGYLGFVRMHDRVGRQLAPGWDREGALTALRRAREFDSENPLYVQNLAVSLERNGEGILGGDGADLEAALEQWRILKDEMGHDVGRANLLQGLARTRRYDELEERARAESSDPVARAWLLVAVTAQRGTEAAVEETLAWEAIPRRAALGKAGGELMLLGRWAEAAGLLELAAEGADDAAKILDMVGFLRRIRSFKDFVFDPSDPESVVRQLFVVVAEADPAAIEAFAEQFPRLAEAMDEDSVSAMSQELEEMDGTMPRDAILDMVVSMLEFRKDSLEGVGSRLELRMGDFQGGKQLLGELYFATDGGVLRVVDDSDKPGELPVRLGLEVLDRLERAGEATEAADREAHLAAARQWLDWAREKALAPRFDDPLLGDPLALFWRGGQEGTEEEIRLAAAALLAEDEDLAEQALPILDAAWEQAEGAAERLRLTVARIEALDELDDPEGVVPLAEQLLVDYPDSSLAWIRLSSALMELERLDELEAFCDRRLEKRPRDEGALGSRIALAFHRQDLQDARRWLERAVDEVSAARSHLNSLAWLDVVEDRVDETTLERAHESLQSPGIEPRQAILHTLATVYADLDRPVQARDVLHQLLALRDGALLHPDWYVVGRMAEAYGELDAARAAYARVEPEEGEEADLLSTYRIAQRRLALLEGEAPGGER